MAYYNAFGSVENLLPENLCLDNIVDWLALYSLLILATLLWCTVFIVYRILRVDGAAGRMGIYQRVIEMLVESALLYSAMIVALLVLEVHNEIAAVYAKELASTIRVCLIRFQVYLCQYFFQGMAPTILVGRVAVGHARPDDSWSENTSTSSLQFRSHSSSQSNSLEASAGSESDTSPRITLDL